MPKVKFDEKNRIWKSGDDPMVYNPNVSLANVLLRSMDLFGSKIAQVEMRNFTVQKRLEMIVQINLF